MTGVPLCRYIWPYMMIIYLSSAVNKKRNREKERGRDREHTKRRILGVHCARARQQIAHCTVGNHRFWFYFYFPFYFYYFIHLKLHSPPCLSMAPRFLLSPLSLFLSYCRRQTLHEGVIHGMEHTTTKSYSEAHGKKGIRICPRDGDSQMKQICIYEQ